MGSSNSLPQAPNTETIEWRKMNTNDMSSYNPNIYNISPDASKLVLKLHMMSESSSDFMKTTTNFMNKTLIGGAENMENIENTGNIENTENTYNTNSPFLSSEMYNYIMNKYQEENNVISSEKINNLVGGENLDDDSDTTSTSSSNSDESELELNLDTDKKLQKKKNNTHAIKPSKKTSVMAKKTSLKAKKTSVIAKKTSVKAKKTSFKAKKTSVKAKKPNAKITKNKIHSTETESYMSSSTNNSDMIFNNKSSKNILNTEFNDYLSSSAHTGGSYTESTILNENNLSISSVRTSELNLISE